MGDKIGQSGNARILVLSGLESGREFSLTELVILGRAPENEIPLSDSDVSRRHARIIRNGAAYVIEDLNSAHGTTVNGERIKSRELRSGDLVQFGSVSLRFFSANDEAEDSGDHLQTDVLLVQRTLSPHNSPSESLAEIAGNTNPEHAMRRLETLLQIGIKLHGERDAGRMLHAVAHAIIDTLEVDRCGLFLRESAAPVVVLTRDNSAPDDHAFSRTLLARALQNGDALVTADAGRDARLSSASLAAGNTRSAMVAPLWGRERIIGAAVVENRGRYGAFGAADLRILVALANMAGTAIESAWLLDEVRRETAERVVLSRFLSPTVAEEIRSHGSLQSLKGERRLITVLFTDIRGFTTMTETLPPDDLFPGLNRAFQVMVDAVLHENGTVDKFTGDGILAFFGAPLPDDDHAAAAIRAACAIREASRALRTESGCPLPVGIGLAMGVATVGPVGTERRMEYTALGDVVNVAARIVARAEESQILATRDLVESVPGLQARSLGAMAFKGKAQEIEIMEIA